jgi:hypothetical protein
MELAINLILNKKNLMEIDYADRTPHMKFDSLMKELQDK